MKIHLLDIDDAIGSDQRRSTTHDCVPSIDDHHHTRLDTVKADSARMVERWCGLAAKHKNRPHCVRSDFFTVTFS